MVKRSPALARCPVILSEGLAGAGEGARGPWCLREPLRQTQPVAHRGVTLLHPTGRRERSRHPEKQRVLLIPEGSSPGAPERRWRGSSSGEHRCPRPTAAPGERSRGPPRPIGAGQRLPGELVTGGDFGKSVTREMALCAAWKSTPRCLGAATPARAPLAGGRDRTGARLKHPGREHGTYPAGLAQLAHGACGSGGGCAAGRLRQVGITDLQESCSNS